MSLSDLAVSACIIIINNIINIIFLLSIFIFFDYDIQLLEDIS